MMSSLYRTIAHVGIALCTLLGASGAQALSIIAAPGWQVRGEGTQVIAEYCYGNDCRGIRLACVGYGVPAIAYATGLATNRPLPNDGGLTIAVDGVPYFTQTTQGFLEGLGIVPQFQITPDNPLVEALSGGFEAELSMSERTVTIGLEDSRVAIQTFGRECGWEGFQNFASVQEQRAANLREAALSGGARLSLYEPNRPSQLVLSCQDYAPLNGRQIFVDRREANEGQVAVQFPPFQDQGRSFQPPLMAAMTQFGDILTDRDALVGGYVSDWELRILEYPGQTEWTMMVPDYGEIICTTQ